MHSTFDEDTNFNNQEETIGELRDTCKELRADVAHKDKVIEQYSDEARKLFAELTELRTALAERDTEIEGWKADQKENLCNQCELQMQINTLRSAAQQALEALEELRYSSTTFKADKLYAEAKAAITAALESK